jgi:hypothetical protein
MTTTSDDDMLFDDEPLYDYETPTEDAVEDRRSNDTIDDTLEPNSTPSDDDASVEKRQANSSEGRVARLGCTSAKKNSDGLRSVASGNIALMETNRAPVLRKFERRAILKFREARDRYIMSFLDSNAPGAPRTLVSMVERSML